MKDRPKKAREQLDLGLSADKQTGPARTLEVNCSNCGAKFVAYYGYDEENVDTVEVKSCGLCHGEAFKRDNLKGATIRLIAQVTARR
ncbi:MAG: hypothetical protein ACLQDV_10045 [Candidatus Binataceae bacterium]